MLNAWDKLERWLIGLLGGLGLLIYLTQIVGRYLTTEIDFSAPTTPSLIVTPWGSSR